MLDFSKLSERFTTPFYLFDFDQAKYRVNEINSRLPKNAQLCYAIKANSFLLHALKDEDILFEVCSPGELSICEKLSVNPKKIVFSGVVKTEEDVKRAYNLRVHTITLESKTHLSYLLEAIKSEKLHDQNVILRLTGGNQFGMCENDIYECVEKLKEFSNIKIRGIHFFTGTQKKLKKISEEISFIENFCDTLKEKTDLSFSDIEYGPGLGYDYFSGKDESLNFTELEDFSSLIKDSKYNFVVELGRFVASPCGKYITKIVDVKKDDKNRYCLIDGGINHINYYGQMMGMKTPPVEHIPQVNAFSSPEDYTIAGSLCTTADIILRKLPLVSPSVGDLLIFSDIGAYSITEGIYLFLSHPLPAVFAVQNETLRQLRKNDETYIMNS